MRGIGSQLQIAIILGLCTTLASGQTHNKVTSPVLKQLQLQASVPVRIQFMPATMPAEIRALPRAQRLTAWVAYLQQHQTVVQTTVTRHLHKAGVSYQSFWVGNSVYLSADSTLIQTLAGFSQVQSISLNTPARALPKMQWDAPSGQKRILEGKGGQIQLSLERVGATVLWEMGITGAGITVAGADTGVQFDHPALQRQYRGFDAVQQTVDHDYAWFAGAGSSGSPCFDQSNIPCDDHGHGTHTVGTMVGQTIENDTYGVAPDAQWIACRNMDHGFGTPQSYEACFQWFLAPTDVNGNNPRPELAPHVINNSWGCPDFEGCSFDTLQSVVDAVAAAGILIVASAGNSGSTCSSIDTPTAIYSNVFTVGATEIQGPSTIIWSGSSRGPVNVDGSGRLKPDIVAPGVSIRSSVTGSGYANMTGTSMAGPHVAGAAALLLSAFPVLEAQPEQVFDVLRATADGATSGQGCGGINGSTSPNHVYGYGRLDIVAAFDAIDRLFADGF